MPALLHLRVPCSGFGVVDSCPIKSALISILLLLTPSKRKHFWPSTPGNQEQEPFSSLTSVKPGARTSFAAPSAAGPHLDAGRHPAPWGTCSHNHGGSSRGCREHRRLRPEKSSQAGVGPISGRGFPGATPVSALGPKGRVGSDTLIPTETPSPPPPSPAGSQKGSEGEEEGRQKQHRSPNALGGTAVKDSPLRLPCSSQGYILGLALSGSLLPKGGVVPLRSSWLLPPRIR